MTLLEKPIVPGATETSRRPNPSAGKLDSVLGGIDLAMLLAAFLAVFLTVVAVATMAIIDLARLIAGLWANEDCRWLFASFGVVAIWVAARWKKICGLHKD